MRPDIYLLYLLLRLFGLLPLRLIHAVGAGLGRMSLWVRGRTAHDTTVNLAIARPGLDRLARAALLRRVMAEGGKSIT
jgi:KDO2-lipid IV(A) lauroyltransferase